MAVDNRAAGVSVDEKAIAVFTSRRDGSCTMMTHEPTLLKKMSRIVEDDMGVGAAKAESVHRYAPQTGRWPWNTPARDLKSVSAQ